MKIKDKLKSIVSGYKNLIVTDELLEPLFIERKRICNKCPFLSLGICTKCGCVVSAKTRSLVENCPENKWYPLLRGDGKGNNFYLKSELPESLKDIFANDAITEQEWDEFVNKNS